jgi:hypothetical protein
MHGLLTDLGQSFVDSLISDGQTGQDPNALKADHAPEVQLAFPATQQAEQKTQS